jgi:hypothetical protein
VDVNPKSPDEHETRRTPRALAAGIAGVAAMVALVVIALLASAIGVPVIITVAVVGGLCALVVLAYVLN